MLHRILFVWMTNLEILALATGEEGKYYYFRMVQSADLPNACSL